MPIKTKVMPVKYKGTNLFAIYKVEDIEMAEQLGKDIGDVPTFKAIIKFGARKARAIHENIDALKEYVEALDDEN